MSLLPEDYSASHYSLGLLFGRTQELLRECGVPTVGSHAVRYPEEDTDAAWDQPPTADGAQFYGLHAAPSGFPKEFGRWLAVADSAPTRIVELHNLQQNLHKLVPEAAGVLALGSSLRIAYSSPFYRLDEKGVVSAPLPEPAVCIFTIRNPRIQSFDARAYVIRQVPKQDALRPDRGIDFDMTGKRYDTRDDGFTRTDAMGKTPQIGQTESELLRVIVDNLRVIPEGNWARHLTFSPGQ